MSEAPNPAQRHPALDLLARYKAVFQAAWQTRHELAGPKRLADEAAFLPAALSLQATPVHPAPRRAAIVICALFAFALLWAWFGQVDIVAVAPGRIVVSERTKTIQPLEASVVKRVLVRDGDSVQAGQVLVELDPTNAQADQSSVQEQLKAADAELRRAAALVGALDAGRVAGIVPHLRSEWQDIQARLAKLDAEHARRQAEAATVREAIAKLDATLPLARQREADVQGLAEQGFMNQHAGQDRTRERIEMSATWPRNARAWPKLQPPPARPSRTRPPTWPKPGASCASARPRPRSSASNSARSATRRRSASASRNSAPRWPAPCNRWPSTPKAAW